MKRLFLLLIAAVALQACALTKPVDMTTPSKAAFAARSAYAIALIPAGEYVSLVRCEKPGAPVLCSKQAVVDIIRDADLAADKATKAAMDAVRSLDEKPLVIDALVAAAEAAVKALTSIGETYRVKK